MPEYTPEQIEQAKEWMRYQIKWHKPGSSPAIHYTVILSALSTAEDQLKRYEWVLAETEALVMSHEGHIAKLEARLQEAGLISVKERLQFVIRSEANDD